MTGALALTACGSTSVQPSVRPTPTVSSSTAGSAPASAVVGTSATAIAQQIPGCAGVAAGTVGSANTQGLRSTASCTYRGHLVIVDAWDTQQHAVIPDELVAAKTPYVRGAGFIAFLAADGATADRDPLQLELTGGSSAPTSAPTPAAGSEAIVAALASALKASVATAG